MAWHMSNFPSDEEIINHAHEERKKAAALGEEKFGVFADAIDILRYRTCEWWELRHSIRPIHNMTHLYRDNASLARELAVCSCVRSALTNILHVAVLLRSGIIGPIPPLFRVAYELYIDATFLRLDTSGSSAGRMLDWQLADTAKVSHNNPGLLANFEKMKDEYKGEKNYGKPGAWAELPDGKKYHSVESRMHYVFNSIKEEVPDQVVSPSDWQLINEMALRQRAQSNTTVHASPIAAATFDKQVFMAVQAALLFLPTVTAYHRVSNEWIDENFAAIVSELDSSVLIEDQLAWERMRAALDGLSVAVRNTFDTSGTKHDASRGYE